MATPWMPFVRNVSKVQHLLLQFQPKRNDSLKKNNDKLV